MASEIHIPFRCPKCGDRRKFDSLHDLRRHLEHEHSYASSRSQQQHHISGIDVRTRGGRRSPLTEMFRADAEHLEESLRLSKEEEANNKRFRSDYSGLGTSKVSNGYGYKDFPHRIRNESAQSSFRDFGHSSRYQKYYTAPKYANDKQNNMQHIHVLDRSDIDDTFSKSFSQGKSQNTLPFPPLRSQTHFDTAFQPTSFVNVGERHIKDTLSALSQEVLMERANQHETANSLYTAQEMLTSVEQAAEVKIAQQQKVIETLGERLKEKEKKLGIVMHEIKHLGQQQIESMEKVSILRQESEFKTEDLQQQLIKKQHELDALNQKMSEIQHALVKGQISAFQKPDHLGNDGSSGKVNHITENMNSPLNEDSPKHYPRRSEPSGKEGYPHNSQYKLPSKPVSGDSNSKEREITKIKCKAQQLDRDRQNLLIEMQSLLEAAATDNLKLHEELEGRSQELTQLNSDLEQSKQEQAELLEETNALYHQADLSLGKLKMMLKEKEQQLINVTGSLEQARATQVRLAKERDESQKLASEREAVYNSLISSNSFQVQSMKEILNSSIEEKKNLEQKLKDLTQELAAKDGQDKLLSENVGFLKARLAEKEKSQVKMKEELRKREEKLKKAKHEMERMTKFLKDTAEKELEARSKLEDFISGLIDRAGQAEAELQKLKESFGTMSERASRHGVKKVKQTTKVPDLSLLPGVSFTDTHKHPDDSDQTKTPHDSRLHKNNDHSKPHRHKSTSEAKTSTKYAERNNELKRVSLSPVESRVQSRKIMNDSDLSYNSDDDNVDYKPHSTQLDTHHNKKEEVSDGQNDSLVSVKCCHHCYEKNLSPPTASQEQADLDLKLCNSCLQLYYSPSTRLSPMHASYFGHAAHPTLNEDTHSLLKVPGALPSTYQQNQLLQFASLDPRSNSTADAFSETESASTTSMHISPKQPLHPSSTGHPDLNYKMSDPVPPIHESMINKYSRAQPDFLTPAKDTDLDHLNIFYNANLGNQPSTSSEYGTKPNLAISHVYNNISESPYMHQQYAHKASTASPQTLLFEADNKSRHVLTLEKNTSNPPLFKNTPEVDRMFSNLAKHSIYSQPFGLPSSPGQRPQDADKRRHFQSHPDKDQDISDELSLDEHGIMWEPPISRSYSSKPVSTISKTGQHNTHDDTDIDEDLTDYIHEDEQVSHDESTEPEYFISKPKKFSAKHVTKARIADLENDPVPLGDKIAKLLTSLDRKPYHSSARDDYSRNLYANNSQKQKVSSKAANEYSAGDSSDSSPLHKARDVQKRVEQLMQPKPPRVARTISFSKQSDGFDVCQVESDLSSSSYASLGPVKSNIKQMENKKNDGGDRAKKSMKQQENVYTSPPVKENVYTSTPVKEKVYTSTPVKEKVYTSTPVKELKDHLGILSVNDHKNSTVDGIKKDPDIKRAESKPGVSHGYPLASQLHSRDEHEMNNQMPMENLDTDKSNQYLEAQVSGSRSGQDNHGLDVRESTRQEETEQDRDLVKYQEAELKPAKELRVRVSLQDEIQGPLSEDDSLKEHSETRHCPNTHENLHVSALFQAESAQAASSEDDLLDEEPSKRSPSVRKESVDASTDTDLEKLAKPGYLQKGFTVRRNVPVVKHIRRKQRPKPVLKRAPSDDSISSSAEDLDDNERVKRRSMKRMRIALFRIFSYLDTSSLIQVSCVSKDWCRVSRHPSLWKHVTLENRAISSETNKKLGLTGRGIRADESSEDYQANLRGSLEPGLERFLSSCQNTITCLYIFDCDNLLTDKCLWLVSGYCRLLTKLTYQSKSDPITPQLMWALGGGCPGVTSLFVQPKYPCAKISSMSNRCLLLVGQFYKDLQEVGIGGKEFDIAGLLPFVQSCQRLKFILFDHCMAITNDSATALCRTGLKNLHTLHIIGTNVEPKALQTFQGNCRQLKTIVVKMRLQECVEDPSKKKDKENYKKMVKALEALKAKAGIGNIFTLEAGPPE